MDVATGGDFSSRVGAGSGALLDFSLLHPAFVALVGFSTYISLDFAAFTVNSQTPL